MPTRYYTKRNNGNMETFIWIELRFVCHHIWLWVKNTFGRDSIKAVHKTISFIYLHVAKHRPSSLFYSQSNVYVISACWVLCQRRHENKSSTYKRCRSGDGKPTLKSNFNVIGLYIRSLGDFLYFLIFCNILHTISLLS